MSVPPSFLSSLSSTSTSQEYGSVAKATSSTGYEPNVIDNFDNSETYTAIFQNEAVDVDTEPSHSFEAELDDELIRKALSSPLFTQEREESANLRQTYHSHEECLLPAQSFFTRTSTGKPVFAPSSNLSQKRKSSRDLENEQIRILLERQKEQILARTEIQKHELQADSDRRSIQELTGIIDSQRMEVDHTIAGCEQSRRDQLPLKEEMSEQNRALRATCIRNTRDSEELQKSHVLKVEELSRRKLIEDFEAVTSFFQGSNVKTVHYFGDNDAKYPDAEIDDEHTRNSLASPLYLQEREANASLLQVYHSQRESLFQGAQSILACTGKPVNWMSEKRKSSQELDNCQFRILLESEKEHLLAEAKSVILRNEYRADLAENNICELKRKIVSQAVEIGYTRTGYGKSRREQALLREELADRERALRDTRIGSIQKLEELKRDQEFRLEKFPRRRMVDNHFKDVESVRSGQLFHVPIQPALFPLPREPGGLLSRD